MPRRRDLRIDGFTLVEILIVLMLVSVILLLAYKVFFAQSRMVVQSMEFMKVNDHFRRIIAYVGNDIRECTFILQPAPVTVDAGLNLTTPPQGGDVLQIVKQELDLGESFSKVAPSKWSPGTPFDQVIRTRHITYSLERNPHPQFKDVPRFKLIRTELVEDKKQMGVKVKQSVVITDSLREFTVCRTIRKPMDLMNIRRAGDRLLRPQASGDSGSGPDLVSIRITLERQRVSEQGPVYDITLNTSFCKRGREVFLTQ